MTFKTAKLFELPDGKVIHTLAGLNAPVSSVGFSPKGDRLATATAAGGMKVWETRTGRGVAAFGHLGQDKNAAPPAIHSVTFLNDGALATASAGNSVKVWTCEGTWSESQPLGP